MKTSDFNYDLPEHLIAQTPSLKRDESRLLVLDRKTGGVEHRHFKDMIDYLAPGDVLVLNNTKVLPARLIGEKEDTKAIIEVLLLEDLGNHSWKTLTKPAKRVRIGTTISFGGGLLKLKCIEIEEDGVRLYQLQYDGILVEILDQLGEMPLPPYIHQKLEDKGRYQTVYAKELGSAAAPTAGLHFTQELLEKLRKKGIQIVCLTLHVGLGTFRPVQVEDVYQHKMHAEYYSLDESSAHLLNQAKKEKRRIIAVGTTTTRTLETIMHKYNEFKKDEGYTDIFIYPGFEFKAIDALFTNFHLPKSTLMMLISAFANKKIILDAYMEAIKEEYRFFSFGDSMFIK